MRSDQRAPGPVVTVSPRCRSSSPSCTSCRGESRRGPVAAHAVLSSADGDPPAEPQGFLENVYDVALVSREEDAVNHRPAEVRHAGDIVHEAASADGVSGGGWWRVRPYAVLELAGRGAAVLANGVGRRAARSSIYSRGLRARECSFVARPRPAAGTTP